MSSFKWNVRMLMIIFSALMVIFFFVPFYAIGSMGVSIGVSASGLAFGISAYGYPIAPGLGFPVIALILPAVILVLWFLEKSERIALISMILSIATLGFYIILCILIGLGFGMAAGMVMSSGYGSYGMQASITAGFIFIIIFCAIMIILCFLMLTNRADKDMDVRDLRYVFAGGTAAGTRTSGYAGRSGNIPNYAGQTGRTPNYNEQTRTPNYNEQAGAASYAGSGAAVICKNCGKEIRGKAAFCQYCGSPVPKKSFCVNCGAELPEGVLFCPKCGTKQA